MKAIKNLALAAFAICSFQLTAQVTMDFEPRNVPSSANCWGTGAISVISTSGSVINGAYSARTNQLTSSLSTSTWIKSPWLNPGNGKITLLVRLDGGAATSRAVRIRFITYDPSSLSSTKEGDAIADSFTYAFAAPVSGTGSSDARKISYDIPTSVANSSNVYKVMISFIGVGGTGRCFADDVYIPGNYAADPSNGCLPKVSIADKDGDGVADADDAYPSDATRAYDSYYPAKTNGTLLFEDLWPSVGDYDFNDLVVGYRFNAVSDANNNLVEIKYEITPKAIGASFNNGFGFMLNGIANDKVYAVEGLTTDAKWLQLNKNGTEAGQKMATIIAFTSANDILPNPGGSSGVNVDPKATYVEPKTLTFTVKFRNEDGKAPNGEISMKEFSPEMFNPFIIINQERGNELHLAGYEPTEKADTKIFGTFDDISKDGSYYKTKNNLPWALNIPAEIPYATEKTDFVKAYIYFAEWAKTNGENYRDWYEDNEKYRNNDALYIIKK